MVHRSQHDPLVTDETAPQNVLVPQQPTQSKGVSFFINTWIFSAL